MIIVAHDVFEGCSDTDIYAFDTSKFQDARIRAAVESTPDGEWYCPGNDWDTFNDEAMNSLVRTRPVTAEKIITVYID